LQSGIKRLVYQEAYKDTSGIDFLKSAGLDVEQIQNIEDV
jgi:dCMP deaminase